MTAAMLDTAAPRMSTPHLLDALRGHYIKPDDEYPGAVFLTEVTAPGNSRRRADAIHIGLWSSRGYGIDVHELKVSKADFQREIDDPAKAEAWWPHCNRFWIVAPDTAVAPPEMLPSGWGLMIPNPRGARRFKVVVKAEERQIQPSIELLATLLTCTETRRVSQLAQQQRELDQRHHTVLRQAQIEAARAASPDVRKRLDLIEQVEKASGFNLADWDFGGHVSPVQLGSAIRAVVTQQRTEKDMRRVLSDLERSVDAAKELIREARAEMSDPDVAGGAR